MPLQVAIPSKLMTSCKLAYKAHVSFCDLEVVAEQRARRRGVLRVDGIHQRRAPPLLLVRLCPEQVGKDAALLPNMARTPRSAKYGKDAALLPKMARMPRSCRQHS